MCQAPGYVSQCRCARAACRSCWVCILYSRYSRYSGYTQSVTERLRNSAPASPWRRGGTLTRVILPHTHTHPAHGSHSAPSLGALVTTLPPQCNTSQRCLSCRWQCVGSVQKYEVVAVLGGERTASLGWPGWWRDSVHLHIRSSRETLRSGSIVTETGQRRGWDL